MRIAETPRQAIDILDQAFNEGDLNRIMDFYDESALVIPEPQIEARGTEAIRSLYADMLKSGASVRQVDVRVLEADGIALFISRWASSVQGNDEKQSVATTVLRRQSDGCWKVLIDNAQGPSILGECVCTRSMQFEGAGK